MHSVNRPARPLASCARVPAGSDNAEPRSAKPPRHWTSGQPSGSPTCLTCRPPRTSSSPYAAGLDNPYDNHETLRINARELTERAPPELADARSTAKATDEQRRQADAAWGDTQKTPWTATPPIRTDRLPPKPRLTC